MARPCAGVETGAVLRVKHGDRQVTCASMGAGAEVDGHTAKLDKLACLQVLPRPFTLRRLLELQRRTRRPTIPALVTIGVLYPVRVALELRACVGRVRESRSSSTAHDFCASRSRDAPKHPALITTS